MEMPDKDFDKLFKQKLTNYEPEEVPAGLWNNIAEKLPEKSRNVTALRIYSWGATAAACMGAVVLGWLLYGNGETGKKHNNYAVELKANADTVLIAQQVPRAVHNDENKQLYEHVHNTVGTTPVNYNTEQSGKHITTAAIVNTTEILEPADNIPLAMAPVREDVQPDLAAASVKADVEKVIYRRAVYQADDDASGNFNTGRLINNVVNLLDKRKDKVVEFSDEHGDTKLKSLRIGKILIKI